jgi:23S rRNA (cytosine1962-C5)-methyltransferase
MSPCNPQPWLDMLRMTDDPILPLLHRAIDMRRDLMDASHLSAFRLFSGFSEGCKELVIDVYADAAVIHNYADPAERGEERVREASSALMAALPWIRSALVKNRTSPSARGRRGRLTIGKDLPDRIREHGLWYALNLTLHQDCSFYLDTRNLRLWASRNLSGTTVLNTFAYTGSLGVAALGGGAERVVQLDHNRRFLEVAARSSALNQFPAEKTELVHHDFFREGGRLRRNKESFGCVILDPPFYSTGTTGTVDQAAGLAGLINKVRPLVAPGGHLVAISNAVFVSGADYMHALDEVCSDGYVEVAEIIRVPEDVVGMSRNRTQATITDPAPFNHTTKIAVLRMR